MEELDLRIENAALIKIIMTHYQLLSLLLSLPISFPSISNFVNDYLHFSPDISNAFSAECFIKYISFLHSAVYLKILLAFLLPGLLIVILAALSKTSLMINKKSIM